jgi:glutaminase
MTIGIYSARIKILNPTPAPDSPIFVLLKELHQEFSSLHEGEVATYIPELAKADPHWFGICLVTAAGHVYEVGDTRQPFTIQSISKPFVYGLALEDQGLTAVTDKVGVEPTGDAFNFISLEAGTGRPRNPMINAGAIATTGLVAGNDPAHRSKRIVDMLSNYAGRPLQIDTVVHQCESDTGHRNRAIGHMLRNFDIITDEPTPTVDLYFQQCSVSVTCRDLGIMAATLANHGVNPITGQRALQGAYIANVLSVMGTCGMYNWAGEWLYRVGIPAKSGVAGGVLAVLPGQIGIGVFSPRLDAQGNSVRGIKVCETLSNFCDLHLFNFRDPGPALRARFNASQISSLRVRSHIEQKVILRHGAELEIFQLQGNLGFASAESVIYHAMEAEPKLTYLLLDLRRLQSLNESAAHLFHDLITGFAANGKTVVFAAARQHWSLAQVVSAKLGAERGHLLKIIDDYDAALEWCESEIISRHLADGTTPSFVMPASNELLADLDDTQRGLLLALLNIYDYPAGEILIKAGDRARNLMLLESGHASVYLELPGAARKRLATFCPGMVFGELALIDDSPRSATVIADTPVKCAVLELDDFNALATQAPEIKICVLKNLALGLCDKLRKANLALSAIE